VRFCDGTNDACSPVDLREQWRIAEESAAQHGTRVRREDWRLAVPIHLAPTRQEALWFHGGNLHQSRHYSQFLSLQLKARYERIPTPVHGLQAVHHKS